MGLGDMIYIPSFIKIGSAIQKFIGGIHIQHGDRISLLLLFQTTERRLKPRLTFGLIRYHMSEEVVSQ
jgi:hypothetical protein